MDSSNISRYFADNVGLVHNVARKGYGRMQSIGVSVDYEDVVQDMSVVFIKAYALWDSEKGKFSTYFMMSAHHELNKVIKRHEIERLDLKIKSVEEMAYNSSDEALSVAETIACDGYTPEQTLMFESMFRGVIRELSPVAKQIMDWLIDPPNEVEREREARIHHVSLARDMGQNKRAKFSDISLVCDLLSVSGICATTLKRARREIEIAVERNTK